MTPPSAPDRRAGARVASRLRLAIADRSAYPGTTEQVLGPLLEAGGLQAGVDFLLAYSPERINPGDTDHGFAEVPRVGPVVEPPPSRADRPARPHAAIDAIASAIVRIHAHAPRVSAALQAEAR